MQTNESIIAVPISVEQKGQTRQFLTRLVERLDLVLGTRGGDPYVPESRLNQTTAEISRLEIIVTEIVETLLSIDGDLAILILEQVNEVIETLKSDVVISNADETAEVMGASYNQAKAQAVADHAAANAVTLNALLVALRDTGIITA